MTSYPGQRDEKSEVAAVQLSPVLYSRQGTVEKVVRAIHALGEQGMTFATSPETVVPYYPHFAFVQAPYLISPRGAQDGAPLTSAEAGITCASTSRIQ